MKDSKVRFSYYYILNNPIGYVDVLDAIGDGITDNLIKKGIIKVSFGKYVATNDGIERASTLYTFMLIEGIFKK